MNHVEARDDFDRQTGAMLFSRASPKPEHETSWDVWEVDKHMYDLVRAPGIHNASLYRRVDSGPQILRGQARRAVVYRATDMNEMHTWLGSEGLAAAVEDGRQFKDWLDPVDDQWFTGNVYRLIEDKAAAPRDSSHFFVQRFEVSDSDAPAFLTWLGDYLNKFVTVGGAESVRSYQAVRDIGNVLYLSEGNYAVQVTFTNALDPVDCLTHPQAISLLDTAQRWRLRLPYVSTELFSPIGHVYAPQPSGSAP